MNDYHCYDCGEDFKFESEEQGADCPACGHRARVNISVGRGLVTGVKNTEFTTRFWNKNKGTNCPNIGRHGGFYGRGEATNNEQQDRIYQEVVGSAREAHDHWKGNGGSRSSDEFELVARTPLEMHESYVEAHGGDREAWSKDGDEGLKQKLKAAGTWVAED